MSITYNVKSKVVAAFQHALAPLVRVLIRHGVGVHEFSALAKEVYAKTCIREFSPGLSPSDVSVARIAVLSGLTRQEVTDLLANDTSLKAQDAGEAELLANLLQAWHTDPDFVGPYGVPRDLFLTKDPLGLQTFEELIRRYGGGATKEEILEQLLAIDATLVPPAGEPVRVVKRTYIPESLVPQALEMFARGVRRYSSTAAHNLQNADGGDKLFERWVFPDHGILERDWSRFQAIFSERLQEILRELDTKFSWFESPLARGEEGVSVGVGIYIYKDSPDDQRDWERVSGKALPRH